MQTTKTMKNLKTLLVLILGIVASSVMFTSCNTGSDEDNYISPENQRQFQRNMAGTYMGNLVAKLPAKTQYDKETEFFTTRTSVKVQSDSIFKINEFPMHVLDSAIVVPSSEINETANSLRQLRTAISQLPDETLTCVYYIPYTNAVSSSTYSFFVNPCSSDFKYAYIKKQLTYGGSTHDVYFMFYINNYGGSFDIMSRKLSFDLVFASINVDQLPMTTIIHHHPSVRSISARCTLWER